MSEYVPNCPDPDESNDQINDSKKSPRENIRMEEASQPTVASDTWLIARKLNPFTGNGKGDLDIDTGPVLEVYGFSILGVEDGIFYRAKPPKGWSQCTESCWTFFMDEKGVHKISQFYTGEVREGAAFLNFHYS